MKQITKTLCLLLMLFSIMPAKADSWRDPSWEEMLQRSDVVALVSYTSNGDDRASAKITTVYKGNITAGEEIWISGFSNRYGPHDKMRVGDRYIVFLNRYEPSEGALSYWAKQAQQKPALNGYVEALKKGKAYYVQSPTSGDLLIKGKKIQYDLSQTTFYKTQKFYPLKEFETFLQAYYNGKNKEAFQATLLNHIKTTKDDDGHAQPLMMLYLLGYNRYDEVFEKQATAGNLLARYALAKLMGNIKTGPAKQVLLLLLNDKATLVQGETVRQLAKYPAAEVGPVLLETLNSANPNNLGRGNIMNPVMNRIDGGRTQIIKTLGEMNYQPAIPQLLPLLGTKNESDFELLAKTLKKLGSREYARYINRHLDSQDHEMVFRLCGLISGDSLVECLPSLMNYIKKHDRTVWPTKEITISTYGLAAFKTEEVKQFLYTDFIEVLRMPSGRNQSIDSKEKWLSAYIPTCTKLGIVVPKDLLYDCLYDYYGLDHHFRTNPVLFKRKKELEDSLAGVARKVLQPLEPGIKVTALVLLDSNYQPTNYTVRYEVSGQEKSYEELNKRFKILNNELLGKTRIDKDHLISSSSNYFVTGKSPVMVRFSENMMQSFLEHISTFPEREDIAFLGHLVQYNYADGEWEQNMLNGYLEKARERVK